MRNKNKSKLEKAERKWKVVNQVLNRYRSKNWFLRLLYSRRISKLENREYWAYSDFDYEEELEEDRKNAERKIKLEAEVAEKRKNCPVHGKCTCDL